MIYMYFVTDAPRPLIGGNGRIWHPLLGHRLRGILSEVCDAVFHTVPLELPEPGVLSCPRVLFQSTSAPFIRLHDKYCGPSNRWRIRFWIQFEARLRCTGMHAPCLKEGQLWRDSLFRYSFVRFLRESGIPYWPTHSHRLVFLQAHPLHLRRDWVSALAKVMEFCVAFLLFVTRAQSSWPELTCAQALFYQARSAHR